MPTPKRKPIPVPIQAQVLFRDRWLCYLCGRPVVLHAALRLLQEYVRERLPESALSYWHPNWRRDAAPLLDELGASIDHVKAHATGGAHDPSNFKAVCARCNARKSARPTADYLAEAQPWKVKGKHGEPESWDGLSQLFLVLARENPSAITATERQWVRAIEDQLKERDKDA